MAMYSYDQVLTDVRQVYEQLTGLQAPKVDPKNLDFRCRKTATLLHLCKVRSTT
jgi:hypothetical protein